MNPNDRQKSDFSQALAEQAKKCRMKLNLTQGQVSEEIGVETRTILNIENGKGNPKLNTLVKLIRFYEMDTQSIFFPELTQESSIREQFQRFLASCTEEELTFLLPILKVIRDTLQARGPKLADDATT